MIYFKLNDEVFAYESEDDFKKFGKSGMSRMAQSDVDLHFSSEVSHLEECKHTEFLRKAAYADPQTGSDRLFAEAQRMQVMGESGWELVRDFAIARYNEIKAEHPWPVTES